jgi:hypothetical protein
MTSEAEDGEKDANAVVSGWWHDNELTLCPRCEDRRLTPASPSMDGMRVCLACGIVGDPERS